MHTHHKNIYANSRTLIVLITMTTSSPRLPHLHDYLMTQSTWDSGLLSARHVKCWMTEANQIVHHTDQTLLNTSAHLLMKHECNI